MNSPVKTSARVIRLDTWRNQRAQRNHATTAMRPAERIGYRIAGIGFLIGNGIRHEVLLAPVLFPVPNTPVWSRGLANDHGNIVPVFDLGIFIGGADMARDARTVLILNVDQHTAGFVVDQLPQLITAEIPNEPRAPVNTPALQPYLSVGVRAQGVDWWEFDYHAFLLTLAKTHPGE